MPTLKQYINLFAAIGMVLCAIGAVLRAAVGPEHTGLALLIFGGIVVVLSVMAVFEVRGQQKRVSPFDSRYDLFGPRMAQCALFGIAGVGILAPYAPISVGVSAGLAVGFVMLMIVGECASPRKWFVGFVLLLVYGGIVLSSMILTARPYEDLKAGILAVLAIGASWVIARAISYERQPAREIAA